MRGSFNEFNTIFRQISCIVLTSYFLHLVKWITSGTTFSLQVKHYQSSCCTSTELSGSLVQRAMFGTCDFWALSFKTAICVAVVVACLATQLSLAFFGLLVWS